MATTSYSRTDAMTGEVWSRILSHEVKKGLEIAPLIGIGPNAIIQQKTELKDVGDKVTYGLRARLTGTGVTSSQVLQGNEESLTTYSDSIIIDEINNAIRVKGKDTIDQQRVPFSLREEARMTLSDWYAEQISLGFFVQMCGYTASSITYRGSSLTLTSIQKGLNTVTAPSTNRKIFATGSADETVQADSTAKFTLDLVDYAKEKAMTANPKIRPAKVNGKDYYVMYLHPYQVTDLKNDTSTGMWREIQLAAMQGGKISDNPIFTGAIGVYNNVVLRENEDVTTGVHSSTAAEQANVRRAVLLGAQSGAIAYSSKYSKNSPYKWVEEKFDYGRELGVSAQGLMGLKKIIFNSEDFGSLTVSTYAAAHG